MRRVQIALEQIHAARSYTERLLADLRPEDWFRQPTEGVTHLAWQMGHLAMADYRLALLRLRGERPGDHELISPAFLVQFGARSIPKPDPAANPPVDEIRAVFDRVHQQAMREVADFPEDQLDLPPLAPHPLFDTRWGSLMWCARHEMVHAGQIGLLRRLLGKPPQW